MPARGSLAASLQAKEGRRANGLMEPSQRAVSEELNIATENFCAQLESVQKTGMCFSGFNADELDFLVEYLSYITYMEDELLASCGEEASWCGIVLTGLLDAVLEDGEILGTLRKGQIVGEMALFRGGKRLCNIVGQSSGSLACLLFADLPAMYLHNPQVTQKLMHKFGQAASSKLVFPHPMPSNRAVGANAPEAALARAAARRPRTKSQETLGLPEGAQGPILSDVSVRHQVATMSLEARGFDKLEALELLKCLVLHNFSAGQVILQRDRSLNFIGIVLRGSIVECAAVRRERGVGELVGEWWVLSGYPISHDVVGGAQGGTIGLLALESISHAVQQQGCSPTLAVKVMKLIGIGATSTTSDKDKEVVSKVELGSKGTELLYRNKIKGMEATMEVVQQAAGEMESFRKRNDILMRKLQRSHDTLAEKLAESDKEAKDKGLELRKLSKEHESQGKELRAAQLELDNLRRALVLADSETKKLAEIQLLNRQLAAKADELAVLKADLDALDRENAEAYQAQAVELAREQTKAGYQRAQVVARWRWRWAITAVRLELKARILRRAETRAMVVQFLSKKDTRMSALTFDSMNFELDTTKRFLEQAERDRERLAEEREALQQEADQKSSLETRLAQLEMMAQQAMARDRMLEDACRAAEAKASSAQKKADELGAEVARLNWANGQGIEALASEIEAHARTQQDRDVALEVLERTMSAHRVAEREGAQAAARARDAEASLLAMRASIASRLGDADRTSREGVAALERMRSLERQLLELERQRALEQQQQPKVSLVLSRLSELEQLFGDMLAPVSQRARSYLSALQELAFPEEKISPSIHSPMGKHGVLPTPPAMLVHQLPALGGTQDRSPQKVGTTKHAADSPHESLSPTKLVGSTTLPQLRTSPSRVARGAVRVAARRGVSVGELKQLRQDALSQAPSVEEVVASMHRKSPPPLPVLPAGALY